MKIESGCDYPLYSNANRPDIKIGIEKDMLFITQKKLGVENTIHIKLARISKLVGAMEKVWAQNI